MPKKLDLSMSYNPHITSCASNKKRTYWKISPAKTTMTFGAVGVVGKQNRTGENVKQTSQQWHDAADDDARYAPRTSQHPTHSRDVWSGLRCCDFGDGKFGDATRGKIDSCVGVSWGLGV